MIGYKVAENTAIDNRLSESLTYPLASILILNYNGRKSLGALLDTCIRSVLESDYSNFEVLFVDNGSTDDSIEFIKRQFHNDKRLRVIKNNGNFGYAEGNNLGLPYAKGKHIIFLNSDVIVDPSWLSELVKTAESKPSIGICGCKGIFVGPKGALPEFGIMCDIFGFPTPRRNLSSPVFYVPGWSLLAKREVLEVIGAFDSKYFMFAEDLDLCWRAQIAGYQVVISQNAVARHVGGGSSIGSIQGEKVLEDEVYFPMKRMYLFERNVLRTLLKNYSMRKLLVILIGHFSLLLTESLVSIVLSDPAIFLRVYIKAVAWNIFNFKDTWSTRNRVQAIRRVDDKEIQKNMVKTSLKILIFKELTKNGIPKLRRQ